MTPRVKPDSCPSFAEMILDYLHGSEHGEGVSGDPKVDARDEEQQKQARREQSLAVEAIHR